MQKFEGFPQEPIENYWQYPKILNGFWHILNGSEQKILDYILRHTWGWQKYKNKLEMISYNQFKNGIYSKKQQKQIDKGVGLQTQAISNALKGLEEKGFIEINKKEGKTNGYRLKLDPLWKSKTTSLEIKDPTSLEIKDTINNNTIVSLSNKLDKEEDKNLPVSSSKKKKQKEDKMDLNDFLDYLKDTSHRHLQIIREYASIKKPDNQTYGQWQEFISRNIKPAHSLAVFNDEQIKRAWKEIKESEYITKPTLETIIKFLT